MKNEYYWIFCSDYLHSGVSLPSCKMMDIILFFHLTCHSRTNTGADNTIRPMVASDGPTWGAADNGGTDLKSVSSCLVASAHHSFTALLIILGLLLSIIEYISTWTGKQNRTLSECKKHFFTLMKWVIKLSELFPHKNGSGNKRRVGKTFNKLKFKY